MKTTSHGGVSPRKELAMSGGNQTFGVQPIPGSNGRPISGQLRAGPSAMMDDDSRGVGPAMSYRSGQLPAQRAPDHGRHR